MDYRKRIYDAYVAEWWQYKYSLVPDEYEHLRKDEVWQFPDLVYVALKRGGRALMTALNTERPSFGLERSL